MGIAQENATCHTTCIGAQAQSMQHARIAPVNCFGKRGFQDVKGADVGWLPAYLWHLAWGEGAELDSDSGQVVHEIQPQAKTQAKAFVHIPMSRRTRMISVCLARKNEIKIHEPVGLRMCTPMKQP